jgi:hypothetical protein
LLLAGILMPFGVAFAIYQRLTFVQWLAALSLYLLFIGLIVWLEEYRRIKERREDKTE